MGGLVFENSGLGSFWRFSICVSYEMRGIFIYKRTIRCKYVICFLLAVSSLVSMGASAAGGSPGTLVAMLRLVTSMVAWAIRGVLRHEGVMVSQEVVCGFCF